MEGEEGGGVDQRLCSESWLGKERGLLFNKFASCEASDA